MQHKLLARQISKYLAPLKELPPEQEAALQHFLQAVGESYRGFDESLSLIERSMELSSKELLEANRELRSRHDEVEALYKVLTIIHRAALIEPAAGAIADEIRQYTQFPLVFIDFLKRRSLSRATLEILEKCKAEGTFIRVPILSDKGVEMGFLTVGHPDIKQDNKGLANWLMAITTQIATKLEQERIQKLMQTQQANMISASKMSELGKMAGGIAHEVNTPLATIGLLADQIVETLQGNEIDLDGLMEQAKTISNTVNRIAKIVYGLRSFSRDGSSDPFESVKISDIVEETVRFCQQKFELHRVSLKVEVDKDLCVDCRATEISQVLLNLLNNSYDAVEDLNEKWVLVQAMRNDGHIEISVTDSGNGIHKEDQEKIFNPFYTTKAIGKGTGLGLSISIGIIKSHHGELHHDELSSKTRFVIRLPELQKMTT